jgi:hypothetical protein
LEARRPDGAAVKRSPLRRYRINARIVSELTLALQSAQHVLTALRELEIGDERDFRARHPARDLESYVVARLRGALADIDGDKRPRPGS